MSARSGWHDNLTASHPRVTSDRARRRGGDRMHLRVEALRATRPDDVEYGELVAARSLALRRTAYLMCGDWHQAEDMVQVAFIKLHAAWGRVRRREDLDAYLRRTLLRTCIDEKRRARWAPEASSF